MSLLVSTCPDASLSTYFNLLHNSKVLGFVHQGTLPFGYLSYIAMCRQLICCLMTSLNVGQAPHRLR